MQQDINSELSLSYVSLTSFSIMRVDLAAQVLSTTVANVLNLYGGPECYATAKFCNTFTAKNFGRKKFRTKLLSEIFSVRNFFCPKFFPWSTKFKFKTPHPVVCGQFSGQAKRGPFK